MKKILKFFVPNKFYDKLRRIYQLLRMPFNYEQEHIEFLKKLVQDLQSELNMQKIRSSIVDTKLNAILYGLPQRDNKVVELVQRNLLYEYPGLMDAQKLIQELRGDDNLLAERYQKRMQALTEKGILGSNISTALDLGCGDGRAFFQVTRNLPQLKKVIGIDMIDSGWEASLKDGSFEKNFIRTNPFNYLLNLSRESYDLITVIQLIELLSPVEQVQLIDLAYRHLSPGGTLYIEFPNPKDFDVMTDYYWIDPQHIRPVSISTLLLAANQFGKVHAGVFDLQDQIVLWENYVKSGIEARKSHPDFFLVLRK